MNNLPRPLGSGAVKLCVGDEEGGDITPAVFTSIVTFVRPSAPFAVKTPPRDTLVAGFGEFGPVIVKE
jgi:hypothetical protein